MILDLDTARHMACCLILLTMLSWVGCGPKEAPPPAPSETKVPAAQQPTAAVKASVGEGQLRGGLALPPAPYLPEAGRKEFMSAQEWKDNYMKFEGKAISGYKGDPAKGQILYIAYCATCHGPYGAGDGPTAQFIDPKPRNHTDGAYMNERPNETLFTAIEKGGLAINKSVNMPGWGDKLTTEEIWDVLHFIRTLAVPPYSPGT